MSDRFNSKPTNAGPFGPPSFAVGGTGSIIRPGQQVRIMNRMLSEAATRGRVVKLTRETALLDVGEDKPVDYFLTRICPLDEDDPVWIY